MYSPAATPQDYLAALPQERQEIMLALRSIVTENLPDGFQEFMSYGMLSYVVPHALYPSGYHCDPKQPLPLMSMAAQKNFVALYHLGLYGDKDLLTWFTESFAQQSSAKLDMGKSCIRFKKIDQIPLPLIGELAARLTPLQWIAFYEKQLKPVPSRRK